MKKPSKRPNAGDGHPERMAGNFYGRRKAKPLKPAQQSALSSVLPERLIDPGKPAPGNIGQLFGEMPRQPQTFVLEIGFGGGEHLIGRAALEPQTGFIGCEPFVNGMAKAARSIAQHDLKNIRLYDEDAMQLLEWFPDSCLDRIYLLYPDPWPKKRHWKRRFVNEESVSHFLRILKPGGEFRFASDIESYVNWTLRHVSAADRDGSKLEWMAVQADDWRRPWAEWQPTRYEQKAVREGRTPAYFIFRKQ